MCQIDGQRVAVKEFAHCEAGMPGTKQCEPALLHANRRINRVITESSGSFRLSQSLEQLSN